MESSNSKDIKNAKTTALNTTKQVKALNTLMGIVSGIVCDNDLQDNEIIFLYTWMTENIDVAGSYPGNVIYRKIKEVLSDGVITHEERNHLLSELKILSGNDFSNTGAALPEHIASLFDNDPHVIHTGNRFVLTGEFLYGTRESCHRVIEKRGGIVSHNITNKTNYVVVGSRSSPDWITENFGRKLQKAAEMIESGEYEICVVREADWVMAI